MADVTDANEYFDFDNPAAKPVLLAAGEKSASYFIFDDKDWVTIGRAAVLGGQAVAVANDVYATKGNLRFATGSSTAPTGTIRFIGNHGDATLNIADNGATATFMVSTLRFLRYPYGEFFLPGKAPTNPQDKASGGPDWLQPGTACRMNSEAADLEFEAGHTFDHVPGALQVDSRQGLGLWATGSGTIKLHPVPSGGQPAPFELAANGDLLTRGAGQVAGIAFYMGNFSAAAQGLLLPTIDYATALDPSWQVGCIGWMVNVPGQPASESWLAVKTGQLPQPAWQYLVLS